MLKIFKSFENKGNRRSTFKLNSDEEDDNFSEDNKRIIELLENDKTYDINTIKLSINEYVSKIRKQLVLIEKLKLNSISKKQILSKNKNIFSEKTLSFSRPSIRSKEELFKNLRKSTVHGISNIIWNEPEEYGQKITMALNLLKIPFKKFRINSIETLQEIEYILSKKVRTINEVIYLQHVLTLYDVVPSIYINYDLIEPNEVLFNMAICLNIHKFNSNDLIFRFGEYNDKIFFMLVGSVSLFEPLERKCEMDINQYIEYLKQLDKYEEYELIRKIIDVNKIFRNHNDVLKIKMNNEKHIRKKYLQKMKHSKEISKSQDNSVIEVNLNMDLNFKINALIDVVNLEESISSENYLKRIEPPFQKGEDDEKSEESDSSDNEKRNKEREKDKKNKHMIKYYRYFLVKKVVPFNIFGETILDDDENINNNNPNNNNNNNFKKREFTAICNEPSRILYLDLNNWKKYFKFRQDSIRMKNLSTILDIPFLRNINIDYFKSKIFEHFSLFNYKIGDFIFKQNERRKKIYFIRSGEVQLIMKASVYSLNKIIDKKFDKSDIIYRNNISKLKQIQFSDSEYLMNQLNNGKKVKEWRILGIYPKDIIGLDEIIDTNNKYILSAKCSSYNCEIYEIEYKKFKDMVTEDKNVKNLYIQYTKNKMNFLSKRLKHLRTLYINGKFEAYKNDLKKCFLSQDKNVKELKKNNMLHKKKKLKIGIINNILESSLSDKNLLALSENICDLNSGNSETIYNSNNKKEVISSPNLNIDNNVKVKNKNIGNNDLKDKNKSIKKSSRRQFNNILSVINKNKLNMKLNLDLDNFKEKEESKFDKAHTLYKAKSQNLIKFKDFNKLITEHKRAKLKKNFNLTQNSFFKNYLKEIKTIGLDKVKKPKINPFSDLFFSLAEKKKKYIAKSNSSSYLEYAATSNCSKNNKNNNNNYKFMFNKVECLVLDKIIDGEGYAKDNEIEKSNSKKDLKKQIKIINKKKQFPQHLIRRFEVNRKISYFPEKYLYFVK